MRRLSLLLCSIFFAVAACSTASGSGKLDRGSVCEKALDCNSGFCVAGACFDPDAAHAEALASTAPKRGFNVSAYEDSAQAIVAMGVREVCEAGVCDDSGRVFIFERPAGGDWSLEAELKAPTSDPGDQFGWSVVVTPKAVVIGSPGEASCSDPGDNNCPNAGAVSVYTPFQGSWVHEQYIKHPSPEANDRFGWSVAYDDRDLIGIGAIGDSSCATGVAPLSEAMQGGCTEAGAVFAVRNPTEFVYDIEAYLKAPSATASAHFGWDVTVDRDSLVASECMGDPDIGDCTPSEYGFSYDRAAETWSAD